MINSDDSQPQSPIKYLYLGIIDPSTGKTSPAMLNPEEIERLVQLGRSHRTIPVQDTVMMQKPSDFPELFPNE
ncbi:hypothetical protein GCM10009720_21130 [Yaniella flava]|uniref:Uncharacterized protein n=1 Tax=Yaniella flava TaxID=287930 RepID=A0ABN2UQA2_9MICC|nr:hypothetical protein [Micrococcaceae bacterium]